MKLMSINLAKEVTIHPVKGATGHYKSPAMEAVFIGVDGVQNDTIIDTRHHGGSDQAVYVYGTVDYDWWSERLETQLSGGVFGDNMTIEGLESAMLAVGDRLQVGTVLLEVTAPRIPCATFSARMNDSMFVKKFVDAGRWGGYCRVLQTGYVQAGDPVTLTPYTAGERITIDELAKADLRKNSLLEDELRRLLDVPISIRRRLSFEKRLAKQMGGD
jgi:MOSC domain-containing protein YiiM